MVATLVAGREVADILAELRQKYADSEGRSLSPDEFRRALGNDGVVLLRHQYFPRWRPERVTDPNPRLRAFRKIVVEDEIERQMVQAVAPEDILVEITLVSEVEG